MMASGLQNTALMSATVNALIEALEASGVDIKEAKTSIASCVGIMR